MTPRRWWHLDPGGVLVGLAIVVFSLTPSLLPRPAVLQGVLAGVAFGIGYALGALVTWIVRSRVRWRPTDGARRWFWVGMLVFAVMVVVVIGAAAVGWQNEVRALVEVEPIDSVAIGAFLAGAFATATLLLLIGRGIRRMTTALVGMSGVAIGGLMVVAVVSASAYTPSWVSFLFEPDAPVAAARATFEAVHEEWMQLPVDERPRLVTYGLSLGAHGAQEVFADLDDLRDRTDGALFVGSPPSADLWRDLQAARDAGSPAWQPVFEEGARVRWISRPSDVGRLTGPWSEPRVLYLQHATDPITWLTADLLWAEPEWLRDDQRGPDVSPSMRWIPVVTGLQVTIDMLMGQSVPARHGHNFGDVVVDGWREVTGDAGLTPAALDRLRVEIESYAITDEE